MNEVIAIAIAETGRHPVHAHAYRPSGHKLSPWDWGLKLEKAARERQEREEFEASPEGQAKLETRLRLQEERADEIAAGLEYSQSLDWTVVDAPALAEATSGARAVGYRLLAACMRQAARDEGLPVGLPYEEMVLSYWEITRHTWRPWSDRWGEAREMDI